ncbi:MAG: RNA-guided endonuclease IscB [Methanosarcinales archaeon]
MTVYVLSKSGKPLMPTERHGMVKRLLKTGLAKVIKRTPFTIKLLYATTEYTQTVTVGVDIGSVHIPISALVNNKIIYLKEKILRLDVKEQLTKRRQYRRNRRSRKTRYRKPRFLNRPKNKCAVCGCNTPKSNKKSSGREKRCRLHKNQRPNREFESTLIIAPSVKSKADSIIHEIKRLSKILPISKIIVEVASFDTQKMANPNISGIQYQQGTLQGYEIKQYLLTRYGHKCVYCKGKSGDKHLEIEHVVPKSRGGTDRVNNLVIACSTCNMQKGNKTAAEFGFSNIQKQASKHKSFRYSALSQSYKNYLLRELSKKWKVIKTYGYRTKFYRNKLGLKKSQVNDAIAIVSKGKPVEIPNRYLLERQIKKRLPVHRLWNENKKGKPIFRTSANREVFGFKLWDKVRAYHSKKGMVVGYITGLRSSGSFEIRTLEKNMLVGGISYKKLDLIERVNNNYITEWRCMRNSSPPFRL